VFGNEVEQFVQQPFVAAMLGMVCFFGALLVFVVVALAWVRQRKARQNQPALIPAKPAFVGANEDMPDLDLLVNMPAAAPVPPPAPVSPAPASRPTPAANPNGMPNFSAASAPAAPAPNRPARKGTFSLSVKDVGNTQAVELLTVLRNVEDGTLIVQMGDKAYQNINHDTDFRERFNKLMREVGQMVAQNNTTAPTPVTTASTPTIEPEVSPVVEPDPAPSYTPPPPVTPSGKMPGDLPSFRLEDNPMQPIKRGQKAQKVSVPELNIAGAIEAYLQHKLRHTPEFASRSLHIHPAPGGGVSIEVDGRFYDAVGDVADPAVRQFLSATIEEWQSRN
jgi:hypothetical protein